MTITRKPSLKIILGRRIRSLRLDHGLSQKELGLRVNLSQDRIARIENGEVDPEIIVIKKIARALKCTVRPEGLSEIKKSARLSLCISTAIIEGNTFNLSLVPQTSAPPGGCS